MKYLSELLIVFCLFGYRSTIQAQNTISTTGGNATGEGGTVSYTIGQVFYTTLFGKNETIIQGVQQGFNRIEETGINNETIGIIPGYSVYPNPTTGYVKLKVESYDTDNLTYQLSDMKGNLLHYNKVEGNQTLIPMENLITGTYFLEVIGNKKRLKTFKIIRY